MLRSMFAAVSGLRTHQTMMDVTGNNVANVNTTGYKASRTTFEETLTQVVRGGTGGAAGTQGGVNPMQIGLGSGVAATDGVFTQGATQVTGRPTDLAIVGDGMFVLEDPNGQEVFTRVGALSFDSAGNLVGPNGERVMGWMDPDPTDQTAATDPTIAYGGPGSLDALTVDFDTYSDVTIGADGVVAGRTATGELHQLGVVAMARFPNNNGLTRIGGGLYTESANSGAPDVGQAGDGGRGTLEAGTLEMSNVDLAQEFTNLILAQRGFQANARTITASDEMLQDLVNLKR